MRPIDADKLKWDFNVYIPSGVPQLWVNTTCKMVDAQPTIKAEQNSCEYWDGESQFCALRRPQAEPVKHGRWEIVYYDNVPTLGCCSQCGQVLRFTRETEAAPNYCPNCGAKMDGGESDDSD